MYHGRLRLIRTAEDEPRSVRRHLNFAFVQRHDQTGNAIEVVAQPFQLSVRESTGRAEKTSADVER